MLKFKTLSYLFIFPFILIMSGCEKEINDVDTQISIIPSDFDYSLTKDINLTVKVDDKYDGYYKYKVEIFDKNPISNSDADPISIGSANENLDYEASITVSKTLTYIYIRQTSPTKLSVVKMAETSEDNISVNFGTETSVKSITKASSFETKNTGGESEIDDSGITKTYTTPTSITQITATSHTLTAGSNYIIPAGETYSGTISFPSTGTSYLYIEGTWANTASSIDIKSNKIIIQNGGEITSAAAFKLSMGTSSLLFIADGGTFDGNKISIDQQSYSYNSIESKIVNYGEMECSAMSNLIGLYNYGALTINGTIHAGSTNSKILNKGILTVGDMTLHGVFQNANTTTITGKFLADGALGVTMINNGFFKTNNLTIQSSTIHNNGQFIIDNDFITVSTDVAINIASGAIFKTNNYTSGSQSTITMEGNAIFEVTNKMYVSTKSYLYGPTSGTTYALARLHTMDAISQYQNLRCSGNIEIESSDYGNDDIICSGNAKFVEEGSSDFTIEPTAYNLGGNTPGVGDSPEDIPFPIIESSTNVYTYLFEDCWPNLGDYDMNDIVMDIQNISYSKNANNYIESMTLTVVLRADGGVYKLGGAIQLDGIEYGDISSISGESEENLAGEVFSRNSNGTEKNQTYAVIPLFDEAHAALGTTVTMTNTRTDGEGNTTGSKTISLTINFNDNTVSSSEISMKKLNVFIVGYDDDIICADGLRREIHLAGYSPTDLGTTSLFGTGDDNSSMSDVSSLYKSTDNLIWGLAVPGSLSYPSEAKAITKA